MKVSLLITDMVVDTRLGGYAKIVANHTKVQSIIISKVTNVLIVVV